ncbi:MAG TPA: glucose 1-dehydrogenase [Microlunatus sp.]|jgi:NAD(P)-dependent dehydrogenase (short-subunit alcohol dehydrogenase family)|nr:glucose 1-dehydrogenase [Microlunatus sp.]
MTRPVLDTFALTGKKALVTGGNRGIGYALTQGLAEAGASVAFASRSATANAEARRRLADLGLDTVALAGDITASADTVVQHAVDALGGLDIVVNNAGICYHRPALEVPDSEWDDVFDLNVKALWQVSRAAARHFRTTGGGTIVNIGSISAIIVNRPQWQPAYNASKAAVHQLTKSLAAEWAPYDIRVNALAPGYVKTEMAPVDQPEFKARWIDDAPQQRFALPEELAPAVVFLASDASRFMTGSVLVMDGGYTVY